MDNLSEETIEYLQEIGREWLNSQKRLSEAELLDVFGDSIEDICKDKIQELKVLRNELILEIQILWRSFVEYDDDRVMLLKECLKSFKIEPLQEVESKLFYFQRLRDKKTGKINKIKGHITDNDIEKARNVPIIDIAERHLGQLRKTGKSYVTRCPFHQDNSPSLNFYPESNRFFCFGCNATGDVITFLQKLLNHDFKSVILYLLNK